MKIALGTRFYDDNPPERLADFGAFVREASNFVGEVLVAVKQTADSSKVREYFDKLKLPKVHIVSMNVWGKFVPALNAIVYHVSAEGYSHLLLCSSEVELSRQVVDELASYMDDGTLVVGAAMSGHEFREGEMIGSGTTVPWNTLALWNLKYLNRTGFVLAADASFDAEAAGVEEVATCAVLQRLYPHLKVKLVKLGSIKWKVEKLSQDRIAAHIKKISSKKERAEKQLKFLELPPPRVLHIE